MTRTLIIGVALTLASGALAQENYQSWRLHTPTFPSTGGNGVIIGEYRPVIAGDKCTTDFTATLPDGKVYYNSVEFDAVPSQAVRFAPTAAGARRTAARTARRPTACSSRTAWCAVRRDAGHAMAQGAPQHGRRDAAMTPPSAGQLAA